MNELERRVSESLKSVGESYRPQDYARARDEFARRLRGRRRWLWRAGGLTASVTATAVVVALLVFSVTEPAVRRPPLDVTSEFLRPSGQILVGREPSGIAIGEAGVWVANSGDGTIARVGSATDEVVDKIEVGGSPDDIVAGPDALWVTDPDRGTVLKVRPEDETGNTMLSPIQVPGAGRHLDIAASAHAVWVVVKDRSLYRIAPDTGEVVPWAAARRPTDVAVSPDGVWALGLSDEGAPALTVTDADDASSREIVLDEAARRGWDVAGNADLAVSEAGIWIAFGDEGVVVRVDPATERITNRHLVGGGYTGISIYRGLAWAVTGGFIGESDEIGTVTRFDAADGEQVGEPVFLSGRPFDIAVGQSGIWVTNNARGGVSLVDESGTPQPTPDISEADEDAPAER